MDGKTNTATTGTGVSIHWLGGEKVADDYADLYDKDRDSVSGQTESGGGYTGLVWTGGNKMGEKSGRRYAGADEVRLGDLTLPPSPPRTPRLQGDSRVTCLECDPTIPSSVILLSARNAVHVAELITQVVDLFHVGFNLLAPMGPRCRCRS